MKLLSKKRALLFGAVVSVCAPALPSMAAAANWAPVGSTHQLFANDFAVTFTAGIGQLGWSCADTELHAQVNSTAALAISSGRFNNCSGTHSAFGCTVTTTATEFPWTATAPTTTGIQIHRFHLDVRFETRPGTSCSQVDRFVTLTGTLTGASWDPSAVGADRRITLAGAFGLAAHSSPGGLPPPSSLGGSFRDTTGTLDLLM